MSNEEGKQEIHYKNMYTMEIMNWSCMYQNMYIKVFKWMIFFPTKGNFPALFLSLTEQIQWSTAEDASYKYKSRSKRETKSYQSLTSFLISN